MKIINKTKGTILADNAFLAHTFFKRMVGLLGRRSLRKGEALIIRPCSSIHTFFMRFPIDVLFVDRNSRVIRAIDSLKPFRLTPAYFNSTFVIELAAGTIHSTLTCKDDTLLLEGHP